MPESKGKGASDSNLSAQPPNAIKAIGKLAVGTLKKSPRIGYHALKDETTDRVRLRLEGRFVSLEKSV
jgi:hypothetical protein